VKRGGDGGLDGGAAAAVVTPGRLTGVRRRKRRRAAIGGGADNGGGEGVQTGMHGLCTARRQVQGIAGNKRRANISYEGEEGEEAEAAAARPCGEGRSGALPTCAARDGPTPPSAAVGVGQEGQACRAAPLPRGGASTGGPAREAAC
jgi:hypothetical protein